MSSTASFYAFITPIPSGAVLQAPKHQCQHPTALKVILVGFVRNFYIIKDIHHSLLKPQIPNLQFLYLSPPAKMGIIQVGNHSSAHLNPPVTHQNKQQSGRKSNSLYFLFISNLLYLGFISSSYIATYSRIC